MGRRCIRSLLGAFVVGLCLGGMLSTPVTATAQACAGDCGRERTRDHRRAGQRREHRARRAAAVELQRPGQERRRQGQYRRLLRPSRRLDGCPARRDPTTDTAPPTPSWPRRQRRPLTRRPRPDPARPLLRSARLGADHGGGLAVCPAARPTRPISASSTCRSASAPTTSPRSPTRGSSASRPAASCSWPRHHDHHRRRPQRAGAIVVLPDDDHDGIADALADLPGRPALDAGPAVHRRLPLLPGRHQICASPTRWAIARRRARASRSPTSPSTLAAALAEAARHRRRRHDLRRQRRRSGRALRSRRTRSTAASSSSTASPGGSPVAKGFRNPIAVRCARGHNRCFARRAGARLLGQRRAVARSSCPIRQGDDWGFPCCATKDLPYPDVQPVPDCSGSRPRRRLVLHRRHAVRPRLRARQMAGAVGQPRLRRRCTAPPARGRARARRHRRGPDDRPAAARLRPARPDRRRHGATSPPAGTTARSPTAGPPRRRSPPTAGCSSATTTTATSSGSPRWICDRRPWECEGIPLCEASARSRPMDGKARGRKRRQAAARQGRIEARTRRGGLCPPIRRQADEGVVGLLVVRLLVLRTCESSGPTTNNLATNNLASAWRGETRIGGQSRRGGTLPAARGGASKRRRDGGDLRPVQRRRIGRQPMGAALTPAAEGRALGYRELLRRNHNFRRLWFGQVVSQLGDWFDSVALLRAAARADRLGDRRRLDDDRAVPADFFSDRWRGWWSIAWTAAR